MQYTFFEPEATEIGLAHLAHCGEVLTATERSEVLLAMKRLGSDAEKKVEALRFWGKLYSLAGCYYVFECRMSERPEKVGTAATCESCCVLSCDICAVDFATCRGGAGRRWRGGGAAPWRGARRG